jgi:hypothetical protein
LRYLFLLVPFLIFLLSAVAWSLTHSVSVTVDQTVRFQTMDGWEGTADLPEPISDANDVAMDALLDAVVDKVGLNRIRLEIRSGAETASDYMERYLDGALPKEEFRQIRYIPTNDNDDPFDINWNGFSFAELDYHIERSVLPLRERLRARGEDLTVNLCYVAFIPGWHVQRNPEEYAEFVLATYIHMNEKYGFVPDMWEVMLEPDIIEDSWSGRDLGAAIVAAARRLKENGYEPAFVAPSVTDMRNAVRFLEGIQSVPGAIEHVVEFSYHSYAGRNARNLRRIASKAEELGLRTSMTEWWFGKATLDVLYDDLKIANVSAWQGRVINGYVSRKANADGSPSYVPRDETIYTSNIFRNVRKGAVRIEATPSSNIVLDPLAFANPDGSISVFLNTKWALDVSIDGLPEGRYDTSYTTKEGTVEVSSGVEISNGEPLSTSIPAAGLITVTQR